MKFTAALTLAMAVGINAHCIMQKISINGAEQGTGTGIRLPTSNNPITNVNDGNIACNANQGSASKVLDVKAGDKIGGWFGHVMGGAQGGNDPDHPIAKSHKGPVIVYLAKVNSASSTGTSGLQWTKIYADGLDGSGQWGVDRMINSGGWVYFNVPSCIPAGQYLMRIEIIALHNASNQGGAQFYMSCAQVNISGGGSKTGSTMSLPGGYKSSDPGITINIYDSKGQPTGGGKPYTIPGPAVLQC